MTNLLEELLTQARMQTPEGEQTDLSLADAAAPLVIARRRAGEADAEAERAFGAPAASGISAAMPAARQGTQGQPETIRRTQEDLLRQADGREPGRSALWDLLKRPLTAGEAMLLRPVAGTFGGLEKLYADVGRAVSSPAEAGASRFAAVTQQEEAAPGTRLTVAELDRAIRRDSRRYDGGMSIY